MEEKYVTASSKEQKVNKTMLELFHQCPLPEEEKLDQLAMFIGRMNLQNILLLDALYRQILDTHGIIIEFGTRWGLNAALLTALRGVYEPYVRSRKILAFDTFEGFMKVDGQKDSSKNAVGDFAVAKGYEHYLNDLLACHEQQSPIAHIKKYEVIKGDAVLEAQKYFKAHPETLIAFVYFDMNLYEPTKKCLEAILPHMTKGGIIAFDQLNFADHPGETVAFKEVFGGRYQVRRTPLFSSASYVVIE